jgi:secretion/DNA translocation related TadE-like protein
MSASGAPDQGSGAVLAVAVVGALVTVAVVALPLSMAFAQRHAIAVAADAAALAAADVVVGLIAGFPCAEAQRVADANGVQLASCELDGLIVTVAASGSALGIPITMRATAGPPRP